MSGCQGSRVGSPRRVAVLRALALGDLLCAVPALRAMRRAWPDAELTLIGLSSAREFAARFATYIDRLIEFPGYPGLPEREPRLCAIPSFLAAMQREQFDLAIQLQGAGTIVNSLVALFGAKEMAGFCPPDYFCPNRETFLLWPKHGLEIHRLLALCEFLGLPSAGDHLELPLNRSDFAALGSVVSPRTLERPYVVVHPGASVAERRWPADKFAAVADQLAEDDWQIVLTGVAGERDIVNQVVAGMSYPAVNLCGGTNLGTLGALVSRARLVVCNDTGISHVAAATQTPSVVISTGDNPARWAPIDRRRHRVLCHERGLAISEVLAAAQALLVTEASRTSDHESRTELVSA